MHSDVNSLIGDFATFHVIGVEVPADRRLSELIQDVQHVIAEASVHQSIPYALLSSLLSRKSKPNGLPPESEPPITCELLTDSGPDLLPGLTIHRTGLLDRLSRFPMPLRIMCNELKSGPITMRAAYHTQRFDDAAIRAMLATLIDILAQVSASPDVCVSSLVSLTSVNRSLTLQ
jgi:non-ribosomal peptide synthetase component F